MRTSTRHSTDEQSRRGVPEDRGLAPLIVAVAIRDWTLKALALSTGVPHLFSLPEDRPLSPVAGFISILVAVWLTHLARSRGSMVGLGLLLGAWLGNSGELIALGRVTDFIPFPPGHLSSPADFCLDAGLVLLAVGVPWDIWQGALGRKRLAEAP